MKYLKSNLLSISRTKQLVHSKMNSILQAAKAKSVELGIYEEQQYITHQTMTPYLFGESIYDRTVDATIFFSILYYLDDYFGEDTIKGKSLSMQELFKAWKTGVYECSSHSKINQLYHALAYISKQIQSKSTPEYFKRFTESLLLHSQHSLHPINYTNIEEYLQTRIHFGGMYPTIDMIEYVYNEYLTDELQANVTELTTLRDHCALIGALSNDLFSYHKEAHSRFNLLNAYKETLPNCTLEQAIQLGITKVNKLHEDFQKGVVELNKKLSTLKEGQQKIVANYVEGLKRMVAASYHWQVNTSRYRSPDSIFIDMQYI